MRQIANATYAALMRHIPVVAGSGIRSKDKSVYNAAFYLMLAYKRMRRAEAINRRRNGHGKG